MSKKQSKKLQQYKEARREHYKDEDNRVCAICGRDNHLSIHHTNKRYGSIADTETFITLCVLGDAFDRLYPELNSCNGQGCHQGVEANKNWAREQGYLI